MLSSSRVQDELLVELQELEQEELNKKMTNVRLPSVPASSLPAQPDRTPGRMPSLSSAAQRSRAGLSLSLSPRPVVTQWPEMIA